MKEINQFSIPLNLFTVVSSYSLQSNEGADITQFLFFEHSNCNGRRIGAFTYKQSGGSPGLSSEQDLTRKRTGLFRRHWNDRISSMRVVNVWEGCENPF